MIERSRQQLRKSGMSSLYAAAGREVCTRGLIDRLDDPKLHQAASPYFEARKRMQTAEAKLQELDSEEENLELERMTLLDGKGVNERRAELLTMQRNRENGLQEALRDLGRSYTVAKSRPAVSPDLTETVNELEKLYEARRSLEKKRKRVDAAAEIIDLDEDRSRKEGEIERLERERERLDTRISEIREEISEEEERRKKLVKAKGKSEDLLD
jgi:prefoldin subunit 5